MDLHPCPDCRRHVASSASRCPFCHAAQPARIARTTTVVSGRLCRAAIFASAAACYSSSPPTQNQQAAPRAQDQQARPEPPAEPPPAPSSPPDAAVDAQPIAQPAPGTLRGVVIYYETKKPFANVMIEARGPGGKSRRVRADANGEYVFADLEPGRYAVALVVGGFHPRSGPQTRVIEVVAGQTATLDLTTPPPRRNTGPCCKPYGAPPARRRVV